MEARGIPLLETIDGRDCRAWDNSKKLSAAATTSTLLSTAVLHCGKVNIRVSSRNCLQITLPHVTGDNEPSLPLMQASRFGGNGYLLADVAYSYAESPTEIRR